MTKDHMPEKQYLTLQQIPDVYPFLSVKTIRRLRKEGKFPPGKLIRVQIRVWSTVEIEQWLDQREEV